MQSQWFRNCFVYQWISAISQNSWKRFVAIFKSYFQLFDKSELDNYVLFDFIGSSKAKRSLLYNLNLGLAYAMFSTEILIPAVLLDMLHWISPCQSSLLGYWLLNECWHSTHGFKTVGFACVKFLVFILKHYFWQTIVIVAIFFTVVPAIFCSMALSDHLNTFFGKVAKSKK